MPKFFTNAENGPAKFTGLSTGSWDTDIDLDLDATFVGSAPTIPAEATGVVLRFVNTTDTNNYAIGARHPDSSTNRISDLYSIGSGQSNSYAGINSAHEIDIYIESTNVDVYLLGYFTAEANFLADGDQTLVEPNSSATWEVYDLSGSLTIGAKFAIFEVIQAATNIFFNFRYPGSADDRTYSRGTPHDWVIVPVNGDREVELYAENTSTDFYLVGEVVSNAEVRTTGGDVSISTTGSYTQIDFSSFSPPTNARFAIVEVTNNIVAGRMWGIRPYNDTSYTDLYADMYDSSAFTIIPIDDNGFADGKIENTNIDYFVWGWITEESIELPIEITGTTIDGGVTETEIKDGSETIIMTIDGDTFVSGTTSEDAIVAGLNGSASWNSEVRDNLDNTDIVLSVGDTVATITLPTAPGYSISANDTVIPTIPADSLTTTTEDTVATPNIIVTNESEGIVIFRRRIEHAA